MNDDQYIWVCRWSEFQTYSIKRGRSWAPPWIKLWPRLLDDPAFLDLAPNTRMVLVGIWMLFGRSRGQVANDTRRLSRQLHQRVTNQQLKALNHAGFIRFCSGTVQEQLWNAFRNGSVLEEEEEEEREKTQGLYVSSNENNGQGFNNLDHELLAAFADTQPDHETEGG